MKVGRVRRQDQSKIKKPIVWRRQKAGLLFYWSQIFPKRVYLQLVNSGVSSCLWTFLSESLTVFLLTLTYWESLTIDTDLCQSSRQRETEQRGNNWNH